MADGVMTAQNDHSDETLSQLLHEAAMEKDRAKWMQLLRRINRIRAERWLKGPRPAERERQRAQGPDTLDLFAGVPGQNATWMERVTGMEQARRRIHELAAETPGEYFVFEPHSHAVPIRIDSRAQPAGAARQARKMSA